MAGPYRILVSETGEITPYTGYVPADYLTDGSFAKSNDFAEMLVPRVVESSIPFPDMDWTSYPPRDGEPWGYLHLYWGSAEDELAAGAFYYAVPQQPEPEPGYFWTNFRGCKELFNGTTPPATTTPNATSVASIPYSAPLGKIPPATMLWFEVVLASGTYTFNTASSLSPTEHDTHIALYGGDGAVIAENDDIDYDGGDYRSSITRTLPAGTYYVAVGPLGGTAGGGFAYAAGDGSLAPTGGVFKIEAA